jgi:hypothetical protein
MLLLRSLVLPLVLVAASALAGVAAAQDSGPNADTLQRIQAQVSEIRGFSKGGDVNLRFLDQVALHNLLVQAFDRDYLPIERESDQKQMELLGLIEPTDDIVRISLDLLTDQVVGVYDPDLKAMFVLQSDQAQFGPAAQVTFAHEFTHALQDQRYDLNRFAPKHAGNTDRTLALHALIEGDALLAQHLWSTRNLNAREQAEALRAGGSGGVLQTVPLAVRAELLFPYIDGYRFVSRAYFEAQSDYRAVDELFRNPPQSTAQVLHIEKYRAGIPPVEVPLPNVAATLGPDWRAISTNVLGELDLKSLLRQYGDRVEAENVAAHWAGDRWMLVENDGRPALVLKTVWDAPDAAQAFFDAYGRGLRTRFPTASVDVSTGERQVLSTPIHVTELRLSGNEVLAVISFDRTSAAAIVSAVAG